MSSPTETKSPASRGKGATFTYVLGAFAVFAIALSLIQSWKGSAPADERAALRAANTAEIKKSQDELVAKMGLDDKAKASATFEKTAAALKSKTPAASKMMVPGSATQLKSLPPPAPAAPAPTAAPAPAAK